VVSDILWVQLVVDKLAYFLVLAGCQVVTVTFFDLGPGIKKFTEMNLFTAFSAIYAEAIWTKFDASQRSKYISTANEVSLEFCCKARKGIIKAKKMYNFLSIFRCLFEVVIF
jgi:hypothetical protein